MQTGENEEIFNTFEKSKDEIEEAFGEPLEWQLDSKNSVPVELRNSFL